MPPIPLLTVLATVATPLSVFAKNSLLRPSPLGAQVWSHACALSAAEAKASEEAEDAERVRVASGLEGTARGR